MRDANRELFSKLKASPCPKSAQPQQPQISYAGTCATLFLATTRSTQSHSSFSSSSSSANWIFSPHFYLPLWPFLALPHLDLDLSPPSQKLKPNCQLPRPATSSPPVKASPVPFDSPGSGPCISCRRHPFSSSRSLESHWQFGSWFGFNT